MFSDVLKRLRIKSGLSQEELANRLGLAKSTISMYENGSRQPNFEILEAIADTFNVDMNTLIGKPEAEKERITQYNFYLSDHEKNVIVAYRRHPEMHSAVDTLLGIAEEAQKQEKRA